MRNAGGAAGLAGSQIVTVQNKPQLPLSVSDVLNEVSDLATGAAIMTFALAPFALPFLALTAVVSAALVVPVVGCALIAWSCMVALRRGRALGRSVARRRLPESPDRRFHRCDRDALAVGSVGEE
jgi:hypothetical protein